MKKKYLILIVDDQEENRILLRKILENTGFQVQESANGKEGLKLAQLNQPDMIISDILMPVMDGFRFCLEIKKDDKLKNIPFIFFTATYVGRKDEEFALSLGAEKHIVKPVATDKFIKIIQKVIKEVKKRNIEPEKIVCENEKEVLKLYSERLANKLEKKMLDLEKETAMRRQGEGELEKHRDQLEELVNKRTAELEGKNKELKRFNKLFIGREFRIKELKDKVKELEKESVSKK